VQDQTTVQAEQPTAVTGSTSAQSSDSKTINFSAAVSSSLQKPLPKKVKDLGQKFKERFKVNLEIENRKQQELNAIPYYVDLKANKFSVLDTRDDSVDEENPYNIGVAAFIGDAEKGEVYHFKDDGLKEEAKPILDALATYIHKVYHTALDWRVEGASTPAGELFKLVNLYVADLYYYNRHQIKGAIVPKSVLTFFTEKHTLPNKKDMVDNQILLRSALRRFNTGKHSDRMADAFIHLITAAFRVSYNRDPESPDWWKDNFISQHKKFTPTAIMLQVKGHLPDVKLGKYRNLFLDTEWEMIKESALAKAETTMQKLMKVSITASNFSEYYNGLEQVRVSIDNALSKEIKQVRKERLRESGNLKALHRGRTPFKLSDSVAEHWSNDKVRNAFNVFRIPNTAGLVNQPSSFLINGVVYNAADFSFTYECTFDVNLEIKPLIEGLGQSLVTWLNK
jgi:hypothetical protein